METPGSFVDDQILRGHFARLLCFRTALPRFGAYHPDRGGMPLHDAVGVNCKKGAATENQDTGA